MEVNQIAVIMPVYKAHETIKNTMHSIAMQRHITYKCYLVVDGEEKGSYDYLLDEFKDINIELHYLEHNVGPGVARQYGIDNSNEPYISFIDADDTYLSSLALYYQHAPFDIHDKTIMVSCDFLQENKDHSIKVRENDMVWMHGKMYSREFLDKYDIRFNETRANEDVGFNTQCQCYANADEQVEISHNVTYMWQWRDNSTVRTDNQSYAFNESIEGFVDNKIYAFERVLEKHELDEPIQYFMMSAFMHLFKKYLLAMFRNKAAVNHVKKHAKRYYKKIYPLLEQDYINKAEKTILAQTGLDKVEHYEEFCKWKELLLSSKPKKRKRK